jgi:hypothetical protein
MPAVVERINTFTRRHPELMANIHPLSQPGVDGRRLLSVVNEDKLRRILARMLDENQFLSPFGIRSLSREHAEKPFVYQARGQEFRIDYQPGESLTGAFGGNSNWRGPVWYPVNALLLRGLLNLHRYFGDGFQVECPTGSGKLMNLYKVAGEIRRRLESTFLADAKGRRPVNGESSFQTTRGRDRGSSTSTSTATRAEGWGPATRPAGPDSSHSSSISSSASSPTISSSQGRTRAVRRRSRRLRSPFTRRSD